MLGSKISNTPDNNGFTVSLMDLKSERGHKEDYTEMGESKMEVGSQDT